MTPDSINRNFRANIAPLSNRSQMACPGFTLVEILIVVAIIALLAAIAIPNYIQSRVASQKTTCINNLRQIEYAIQQWAVEMRQANTASVTFSDISPYLKGDVICPAGGKSFDDSYAISDVATAPTCQLEPQTHVWMGSDVELGQAGRPGPHGNNGNHGNGNNGNGNGNGGGN